MTDEAETGWSDPHDKQAERAVLGAILQSKTGIEQARNLLRGDEFYVPVHGEIWTAAVQVADAGQPVGPVAVKQVMLAAGQIGHVRNGVMLADLAGEHVAGEVGYYAGVVADLAVRRRVLQAGRRIAQWAASPGGDSRELAEKAAAEVAAVRDTGLRVDEFPATRAAEFMAQPLTYDWLVPGLLEKGDRLIITGPEGLGKSMLIRQVAVAVAAGFDPFTADPIDPSPVLVVDCENGEKQVSRLLQGLESATQRHGVSRDEWLLWVACRPSGINLLDHSDRRWLLRQVEQRKPALLTIGPVYKLHDGDPNKEESVRAVQKVLDECRAMGCTLLIEHHAGHGDPSYRQRPVRPAGSSLWLRWPEFGYGLRLATDEHAEDERLVDMLPWRGPREERAWPKRLCAGSPWPWAVARNTTWR